MNDNLKPFQAGSDPRRNTKGRPKSFNQLRALAIQIADEPVKDGDTVTRIEKMLREMAKSDNPSDRALLLKYAFGNVPDEAEVKAKVTLLVKYADKDTDNQPA